MVLVDLNVYEVLLHLRLHYVPPRVCPSTHTLLIYQTHKSWDQFKTYLQFSAINVFNERHLSWIGIVGENPEKTLPAWY